MLHYTNLDRNSHPSAPRSQFIQATGSQVGTTPENATALNPTTTTMLWDLFHQSATLRLSLRESQGRLFDRPFQIAIGGANAHFTLSEKVRAQLVEAYWMPWLRDMDIWLRTFGVAPWYFETVESSSSRSNGNTKNGKNGKAHQDVFDIIEPSSTPSVFTSVIPRVPPFGSGHIESYMEKGIQHLQWKWNRNANMGTGKACEYIDPNVFIEIEHMPTIFGNYTCEFATMLHDHNIIRDLHRINFASAQQALQPLGVVEFHPNLGGATGDNGTQIEGANLLGQQTLFPSQSNREGRGPMPLERINDVRNKQIQTYGLFAAGAASAESEYLPPVYTTNSDRQYTSRQEMAARRQQLYVENHPEARGLVPEVRTLPANSVVLKPYEHYISMPVHTPDTSVLLPLLTRLDQILSAFGDFPLEMIMSSGGTGGKKSSGGGSSHAGLSQGETMASYVGSRLRTRSNYYTAVVRHAWIKANSSLLLRAQHDSKRAFIQTAGRGPTVMEMSILNSNLDIKVIFPRSPLLSFSEMANYYQHGMITAKNFDDFAMDIIGLSDLTPPGDRKLALEKRMKKLYPERPLDATTGAPSPMPAAEGAGGAAKPKAKPASSDKKRKRDGDTSSPKAAKKAKKTA